MVTAALMSDSPRVSLVNNWTNEDRSLYFSRSADRPGCVVAQPDRESGQDGFGGTPLALGSGPELA
jgi:hypothetical protein